MKRFTYFLVGFGTCALLILASCSYFAPKKAKIESLVAARVGEVTQGAAIANARAKTELDNVTTRLNIVEVPTNGDEVNVTKTNFTEIAVGVGRASAAVDLAGDFLKRDQVMVGTPAVDQTDTVNKLLSENAILKAEAVYKEQVRQKQEEGWVGKINDLNDKLQAYGTKFEQERDEKITRWIKWGSIIAGIIGLPIALMVLFPPLATMLTGLFPSLVHLFNIPLRTGSNVIRAVGDAQYKLNVLAEADAKPGAVPVTYTAAQMSAMLSKHLAEHIDNKADTNIVNHLKEINNA